MLEVSQAWLDNQQKTIVGESDVIINLGAVDPVTWGDVTSIMSSERRFTLSPIILCLLFLVRSPLDILLWNKTCGF